MAVEMDGAWEGFERRLARIEQLVTQLLDRLSSTQTRVEAAERALTEIRNSLTEIRARVPQDCEEKRSRVLKEAQERIDSLERRLLREVEDVDEQIALTKNGLNGRVEKEIGKTITGQVRSLGARIDGLADAHRDTVARLTQIEKRPPEHDSEKTADRFVAILSLVIASVTAVTGIIFGILNAVGVI